MSRLIFLLLTLSAPAWAGAYPWVDMPRQDLQVITDASVEMSYRLALIRKATDRIDLAIYDQRTDGEIALPLLQALRDGDSVTGRAC